MKRPANLFLLALLAICALSFWYTLNRGPETTGRTEAEKEGGDQSVTQPPSTSPAGVWQEGEEETIVHLAVLNGTEVASLAREVSLALAMSGCVTQHLGNAPHARFERSLLINRRLPPRRAAELASRLGGLEVIEEQDSRTTEDVLLLLGADYERIRRALGLGAGVQGANSTSAER